MKLRWISVIAVMALLATACGDDDGALPGTGVVTTTVTTSGGASATTAATLAPASGNEGAQTAQQASEGKVLAGIDRTSAECFVDAVMAEFGVVELAALGAEDADVTPETAIRLLRLFEGCGIDFGTMMGIDPGGELPADYTEMAASRDQVDGPYSYGEDADLDAFWDACAAGSGVACDELCFASPLGSLYVAFGDSCGNRMDLQYDCSPLGG